MLRLRGLGLLANLVDVATSSGRHAAVLEPAAAGLLLVQGRGSRHQQQRGYAEPAADVEPPSTSAAAALSLESRELTPSTVRSGVIAVKVGMTQEWDQWGVRVPLTVLWIDDCQVVQVKTDDKEQYTAVQLGCGSKRPKQLPATLRGHFEHAGVPLKRKLAEFRVTPDALMPVGTELRASHFVAGQYVDVTGITIGKGFQGVMKKWGFRGGPASHGNSLAHRVPGSTGSNQDPGKVWKGKKMPGRMGGEQRTVQNVHVFKVDPERNLLFVRGMVPGHKGNFLLVKDAVKKSYEQQPPRPVPTHLGELPGVTVAPAAGTDPFDYRES